MSWELSAIVYSSRKSDNVVVCSNRKSENVGSRLQPISQKYVVYSSGQSENVGNILQLIIQISKPQLGLIPESENSKVTYDGLCNDVLLVRSADLLDFECPGKLHVLSAVRKGHCIPFQH